MTTISDPRWSGDFDLIAGGGGLILRDIKHDGFRLARHIRVTRVWVATGVPALASPWAPQGFKLNGPGLPADSGSPTLLAPAPAHPIPAFSAYKNVFGIRASYRFTNFSNAILEQTYLFGQYGKSPAHEPGAVLDAARLFPLLQFEFPAVDDASQPFPQYFRADYMLAVDIDNIDENALIPKTLAGSDVSNKAGIFRDAESLPSVPGGPLFKGLGSLFAAFEKPLHFEIASFGLAEERVLTDASMKGVTAIDTWDNVHIWPAVRGGGLLPRNVGSANIATPGAFHALHCHWRWGAVAGDPAADKSLLPAAGGAPFRGSQWHSFGGGPLIDDNLRQQNLRFAVTAVGPSDPIEWHTKRNPSEKTFSSLFPLGRPTPADIHDGDLLTLWLSFEVFRDIREICQQVDRHPLCQRSVFRAQPRQHGCLGVVGGRQR